MNSTIIVSILAVLLVLFILFKMFVAAVKMTLRVGFAVIVTVLAVGAYLHLSGAL